MRGADRSEEAVILAAPWRPHKSLKVTRDFAVRETAMPFADNQGVHIRYEVEGKGPPLVLQHGLGGSIEWWFLDPGYVEALKDDYQLIIIDARGHGASDKPHDPEAYRMESRVGDVVAVLDRLRISRAHFLGYSMGGWIGWGIVKYAPERFQSLIIGAASPYDRDPDKPSQWSRFFKRKVEVRLAEMEEMFGRRWTPELKALHLALDTKALIALTSVDEQLGIVDILPTMTVPSLLFVGENDPVYPRVKECVKLIPDATFVSFPGLDHIEGIYRIDLVLPHITKFLAEVTQA